MTEEFEIEIADAPAAVQEPVRLPVNYLPVGKTEADDVDVYIHQDVYRNLEEYSSADTSRERGAVLMGEYSGEPGKTAVVISHWIEAKYTDATASTLTFTHETWECIHREQSEQYPAEKIVGWQHTHPGYGIFLSSYDLFIQENFFDLPFQIAYVTDPVQKLRGFFQWKNGKIEKLGGFYIYDEPGRKIEMPAAESGDAPEKKSASPVSRTVPLLTLALAALCLVTSLLTQRQMGIQGERQAALESMVARQEKRLDSAQSDAPQSDAALEKKLAELEKKLAEQQSVIDRQQKLIEEMRPPAPAVDGAEITEKEIRYIVKKGDTLSAICEVLHINYWLNREEVLELNGIEDENVLHSGQILSFPRDMIQE